MTDYDSLFEASEPEESVFADKSALDSLSTPDTIYGRTTQKETLASILGSVHDDYLPSTVSIYGPPGTGKTTTTRRICEEFADRHDRVAVEAVNLQECQTVFSAANQLHLALTGEKKGAYEGLDGVFAGIWEALEDYPEWIVLILDEVDQIQHDANYSPSDFFYRLLRGEGKRARDIKLSAWLISNELLRADLQLDSRVRSAMDGREVFFPPYNAEELRPLLEPRLDAAFDEDTLTTAAIDRGIREAAERWGDARQALRLFRRAGEEANARDLTQVTEACVEVHLTGTEREATIEKLRGLPRRHQIVLSAAISWRTSEGEIVQPVRVSRVRNRLVELGVDERYQVGDRAIRNLVEELDTMGLVDTWVESDPSSGRARYFETTFDPEWMRESELGEKSVSESG